MSLSRRRLLQLAAGTTAALAAPGSARASTSLASRQIACSNNTQLNKRYKVLEVFLDGGAAHRSTLWIDNPQTDPFWRKLNGVDWRTDLGHNASWVPGADEHHDAAYAIASGVHLGPCAKPLIGTALKSRMRVAVVGHDLAPHPPAAFLMATGLPVGRTRGAGLGAAVCRQAGSTLPGGGTRTVPASVILHSNSTQYANLFASTGVHGVGNRPLVLRMGSGLGLNRPPKGGDATWAMYTAQYDAQLRYGGQGSRNRSRHFDAYERAQQTARVADKILARVGGMSALAVPNTNTLADNATYRAIRLAGRLLDTRRPGDPIEHVAVMDAGIDERFYDTHFSVGLQWSSHDARQTANVLNVLRALADVFDPSNGDLSVDDVLVVVHTEFGRVPDPDGIGGHQAVVAAQQAGQTPSTADLSAREQQGSDHAYTGFPVLMMGGPIRTAGVMGSLDTTGRHAHTGGRGVGTKQPSDIRAATLLAAGIHPFQDDTLMPSETSVTTTNRNAASDAIQRDVLGLDPTTC